MSDQELDKRCKALSAMLRVLQVHELTFPKYEKWSRECGNAIEGLRIANKCQALVAHDRVLLDRD